MLAGLATAVPGPALAAGAAPVPSTRAATLPCRDVLFVGARGSGEPVPYGRTVTVARGQVLSGFAGAVQDVYVDYPAANPHDVTADDVEQAVLDGREPTAEYFVSVQRGVDQVRAVLADAQRRCPSQRIVLAGFSQGAQVLARALAEAPSSRGIVGTLLVGNPLHFPGENVQELDGQVATPSIGLAAMMTFLASSTHPTKETTRHESARLLLRDVFDLYEGRVSNAEVAAVLREQGRVLPASAYATTYSVCARGDLVCDAAPPLSRMLSGTTRLEDEFTRTRPIHGGYQASGMANSTAAIARTLAGGAAPAVPRPAVVVSPVPRPGGPTPTPAARRTPTPRTNGSPARHVGWDRVALVAAPAVLLGAAAGFLLGRRSR